ncbi:PAS domain S-box protein [Ancylomarina salipaludis]|uniref:histidine kinase n=1 Tax=Ancylomarina salipaludis TaxID=2501299 RepID=A0A4Q1JK66_9BACT|nr:two-component regulator propeller domain-containing protein [Ancylomarina salipaludis]RXQ92252.1 PAS domain S-box protein [Ancylomarina salipaludis]
MNFRFLIVLLNCSFLLCQALNVRAQLMTFKHYGVEDGISQSEIKRIFQDSEGYLWFATQNGLNKFDGYSFENFFYNPTDKTSISNNWVFDITEDAKGNIWLGTKEGLNRYDKRTGTFSLIPHKLNDSIVPDKFVYGVVADDQFVYINFPPVLSRYNYLTDSLESFTNNLQYDGALHDIGFPILKSSMGMIWLGSSDGLSVFDPIHKTFRNFRYEASNPHSISHNHITALYEDLNGNIVVGTEDGLNFYERENQGFFRLGNNDDKAHVLSRSYIRSIVQDSKGVYWIGTEEGGLNRLEWSWDSGEFELSLYRSGPNNTNYIGHDIVYSLLEDKSQNLWIGTIAGLDRADLKMKKFQNYKKTDDPKSLDLLDNIIGSIYIDEDKRLWVGNWAKGLNIFNPETKEMRHYSSEFEGDKYISNNHVHVLFEDRESRVWMGTRNGVSLFNKQKQNFIPFNTYFGLDTTDFFANNRVYCITENSNGNIWIGTGNGIVRFNPKTKKRIFYRSGEKDACAISSNLVYSILEDRDGLVWIATLNGMDCYLPQENRMLHYSHQDRKENTLCDNFTISLCEDYNGDIWVGTSTGVNRFNKKDSVFTYYSMKDGLPSNIIYDIIEDKNRNLWFSTGNGLAMLNVKKNEIKSYSVNEGLQGGEFNLKAVYQDEKGTVYFGGMDGLVSFHPDSLQDNNFIPPVVITSFEKERGGQKQNLNVYNDKLELTYKDYSFTISYAALDFTQPFKNRYAYKMEGLRDEWFDVGNRHFVHFTNLPSGHYTFLVKGTNNDGRWNELPTKLDIRILPPWWLSPYAYATYVLLGFLLVMGIMRLRLRNLKREKRILEEGIRERTKEIALQKERVEESEEKLKSTISSLNDLVFVLDRDGIFQEFYNPGNTDPLYENPDFFLNKHYTEVGFPSRVVEELKIAFERLQESDLIHEFDYCVNQEGMCWFNAKISPRRNAQAILTGITIVARHITERKEAEERLRQQKEELDELNATKDKFFSILAHDLKNPFASLYSLSQVLDENYNGLDEEDKLIALKRIHHSAELIYNLLENLLTWSKSQRGLIEYSPSEFDLSVQIEENINLHRIPAEKKGLQLKTNLTESYMAYADRQMINTVLRNLVNNAVKFTASGKAVEVNVRREEKILEVEVRDEGVGISPENLEKLFRIDVKYKTVGTSGEKGTGLGLILCHEFVQKNYGAIWCESEIGKGTSFFFTIPCEKRKV